MVIRDMGNYAEVELETASGQATFRAGMKGGDDRRYWNKDLETCELAQFMNGNAKQTQVVVKCGDQFSRVR